MSYTKKNDLEKQAEFLNSTILPLYGIVNIYDTTTEISSNSDTINYSELNKQIPKIKELFKISSMNLARNNYKITKTNAISILKHMCQQARILFDITKYSSHYTFALTNANPYLHKNNIREILRGKEPKPKSISFLEKIPITESDFIYKSNRVKISDIMSFKNSANFIEYLNYKNHGGLNIIHELINKNTSIRYQKQYFLSIEHNIQDNLVICNITPDTDVLESVLNIQYYDKDGFILNDRIDEYYIVPCKYLDKKMKVKEKINIPVYALTYYQVAIKVDDIPKARFVKITTSELTLTNNIRKNNTNLYEWS